MSDDKPDASPRDPLTSATRATKRNLLLTSIVAITFKAFDISADHIPVAGLSIKYDKGVFEFLLLILLCYFLATFILYYYIDIRNFPRSSHQDATDEWHKQKYSHFSWNTRGAFGGFLQELSTPEWRLILSHHGDGHISGWAGDRPSALKYRERLKSSPLVCASEHLMYSKIHKASNVSGPHDYDAGNPEHVRLALVVQERWNRTMRWLPLRYAWFKMTLRPRLWTVAFAYFFRNYVVDGALPIFVALISLAALYNLLDVHLLAQLAPK